MAAGRIAVIGSGFSGGSVAARLAERGYRVTLFERGPWRSTATGLALGGDRTARFPRGFGLLKGGLRSLGGTTSPGGKRRVLNALGLYDVFGGHGLDVIGSSSVGGNSHVYGGISVRPNDPTYWDRVGHGLSAAAMEPHYAAMEQVLRPRRIDPPELGAAAIGKRYPDASGLWTSEEQTALRLAVAPGADSDAARGHGGLLGCEDGSKLAADAVFLAPHVRSGAIVVRDLHEVVNIAGQNDVWTLTVRQSRGKATTLETFDTVILGAGAFNTVCLLLASQAAGLRLPDGLGHGFGGNGDTAAQWLHNDAADLTASFPTLQRIGFAGLDPALDIVEGTNPSPAQLPLGALIGRKMRRSSMLAGMGIDAMDGRVTWRDGRATLVYDPDNSPVIDALEKAFVEIGQRTGTIVRPMKRLFTVHPTGGAGIGPVIDGSGAVHGARGLYVADASALPLPLGTAPSLTVAAWARHVADQIP